VLRAPLSRRQPVFLEVAAALYTHGCSPKLVNYVYGLGGRDTLPAQFVQVYDDLKRIAATGDTEPVLRYLTVRE